MENYSSIYFLFSLGCLDLDCIPRLNGLKILDSLGGVICYVLGMCFLIVLIDGWTVPRGLVGNGGLSFLVYSCGISILIGVFWIFELLELILELYNSKGLNYLYFLFGLLAGCFRFRGVKGGVKNCEDAVLVL